MQLREAGRLMTGWGGTCWLVYFTAAMGAVDVIADEEVNWLINRLLSLLLRESKWLLVRTLCLLPRASGVNERLLLAMKLRDSLQRLRYTGFFTSLVSSVASL